MNRLSRPDYVLLCLCLVAIVIASITADARTEWFRHWLDQRKEETSG